MITLLESVTAAHDKLFFFAPRSAKVKPDGEQPQQTDTPIIEQSRVRKESESRAKSPTKQKPETSTTANVRKTLGADVKKKPPLKEQPKNVRKSKSGEKTKSESKDEAEKTDKKVRHDSVSLDEFSSPSPIDRKRRVSSPDRSDRHGTSKDRQDSRRRDRSRSPLMSTVQRPSYSGNRQRSHERPNEARHRSLDRPQYERHRSLERHHPRQPFHQQRRSPDRRGKNLSVQENNTLRETSQMTSLKEGEGGWSLCERSTVGLSMLSALHKVGALLVLRLVSIARLFHHVDRFTIGVDPIKLYMLGYCSIYEWSLNPW